MRFNLRAHAALALLGSGLAETSVDCCDLHLSPSISMQPEPGVTSPIRPQSQAVLFSLTRAAKEFYIANAPFCCRRSHSLALVCAGRGEATLAAQKMQTIPSRIPSASHRTPPAFLLYVDLTHKLYIMDLLLWVHILPAASIQLWKTTCTFFF